MSVSGVASPTINLRRAFATWQVPERTLCSQQGPKSSARRRTFCTPSLLSSSQRAPHFSFRLTVSPRWVTSLIWDTSRPFQLNTDPLWVFQSPFRGCPVPPGFVQADGWRQTPQYFLLGPEMLMECCKPQPLTIANPALLCPVLWICACHRLLNTCSQDLG